MQAGPKPVVPGIKLDKIPKERVFKTQDDNFVEITKAYLDDLAANLDIRLLQALGGALEHLKVAYQKIKTPQEKSAWFRTTFSFLHNQYGHLSPRLFTYFQQCELLAFARPIYWFDELSLQDKAMVGDKLIEILNKPDTPRRREFFTMLPYRLMAQESKIQIEDIALKIAKTPNVG